jgi:hypothetical protein
MRAWGQMPTQDHLLLSPFCRRAGSGGGNVRGSEMGSDHTPIWITLAELGFG